jgi:hypothetical protein
MGEPSGSLSREGQVIKIRRGFILVVSLVSLLTASSLFAHHGVPNFDMSRTVTIKGVVIDYLLINPHMEMRVKVADDTGNSMEWNVEAVSLLMMLRAGFKRDTFKPGDMVTVTGHPNKDGKPMMVLVKVMLPDGREMLSGYDGGR